MLLNNFLYTRSLIQNEQFHFRTSFSSLIPKTRVNEDLKNPLEDEKYKEEIKNIHIGGRNRKEKRLQREKEKLEEEKEILQKEKEILEEENETLEEEKEQELIENDKNNEKIKKKKEELQEKNEELQEENEELQEDEDEVGDETISHEFNNRKITLDNISKEGGKSHDKDIKNVVVSFF